MIEMRMALGDRGYPIYIGSSLLSEEKEILDIKGRALVLTDSGVPRKYAEAVCSSLSHGEIFTVEEGEGAKSLSVLETVLKKAADMKLNRHDAIISVGGGVVGDLGGFAAAVYMRGISFYNIPTTMLAMVDSSIGGKTAVNLSGIKNIVGAFHQPKGVLIDIDTLSTLDGRQISAGLCEAVKMAATCDRELFGYFEEKCREEIMADIESVIYRALSIKKSVVEIDEREAGLRKVLNFGHTVGHGIETTAEPPLYHGECVALGMLPMCGEGIRPRVLAVLKKCGLYRKTDYCWDGIAKAAFHDKKANGDSVTVIYVNEIGSFEMQTEQCAAVMDAARNVLEGLAE
ncbi:MAG: 3-dehydroquinate synthase [Clostridia bacterium]|nr:3-dehydroquinate synthase [Clostridia bacterium]